LAEAKKKTEFLRDKKNNKFWSIFQLFSTFFLSHSSSSETAQPKTKKGNAAEETNSVDEVSNLKLDNLWITLDEFKKLTEYKGSSTQSSQKKATYSY
jgi:hypothetical protein